MKFPSVLLLLLICLNTYAGEKPNILFIMTDDQAAWTTGYSGNKDAITPALDEFRLQAASLPNTFVNSPVCSCSRASLITSRYPTEVGILEYLHGSEGLSPKFASWPRVLQQNGYYTGLIGKWHLGHKEENDPKKFGYDYFMGLLGGGCPPKDPQLSVKGKMQKVTGFTVDILTEDAMNFLANRPQDKPFLLSLHYRAPHGAYLPVRDEIWNKVNKTQHKLPDFPQLKPKLNKMMKGYSALVSHFDWNFARLMMKLKELGLDENTVVIFTSDHGYNIGHHGATHKGNGDWGSKLPRSYHHPNLDKLPGIKMPNMWDTSLRPPHLIRWPGKIAPNSTIKEEINFVDFFPTMCKISGSKIPEQTIIRGRDFSVLFNKLTKPKNWDNPLLIQHDTHNKYVLRGLRSKKWKIFISFSHDFGFLYDLEEDPQESKNLYLSPEYATVRKEMTALLIKKMKAIGDPLFLAEKYPFSKSQINIPRL